MEDYLYILIGIAWVAYSFYNNKQKQDKKKAAMERHGNPSPQAPPPVRSILEEILMGEMRPAPRPSDTITEEYQPEYLPQAEAISSETIKTEAESLEVIEDEVPANYFEKEYTGRKEPTRIEAHLEIEDDIETEESGFEIAREFNVKKAVIFAEIINPRHF